MAYPSTSCRVSAVGLLHTCHYFMQNGPRFVPGKLSGKRSANNLQKHTLINMSIFQPLESIALDKQSQEHLSAQRSTQTRIATLTHQLQHHEIIPDDYVK